MATLVPFRHRLPLALLTLLFFPLAVLADSKSEVRAVLDTMEKAVLAGDKPAYLAAVIAEGDTVCIITGGGTSSGYAVPGQAGTTLRAKGIAAAAVSNVGGADGAVSVEVFTSICQKGWRSFKRANAGGGGALTQADCGSKVYVADATTVTKTSSGNSPAGELDRIDAAGNPWVIFPISY